MADTEESTVKNGAPVVENGEDTAVKDPTIEEEDIEANPVPPKATQEAELGSSEAEDDSDVQKREETAPSQRKPDVVPPEDNEVASSTKNDKEPPKQANQDFEDVQETGKWGKVSKYELFLVAGLIVAVIVGAVVAAVLLTVGTDNDDDDSSSDPDRLAPTAAPTVILNKDEQLNYIRDTVLANSLTAGYVDRFGQLTDTNTNDPFVRAAQWTFFYDPIAAKDRIVDRFVLAVIYYSTKGENWNTKDGWMSDKPICSGEWYGIQCDDSGRIEEIDLSGNNLQGEIHPIFALLTDLRILWLKDNALSGEVPGDVFGSMPVLFILYLQNNQFTGEIPPSLLDNGVLRKY